MYNDVELVWANCRAFNEPDSDICALADEAQKAFRTKWQQQDLPDQDARPARKKSKGKAGKQQQSGDTSKGGKAKQEAAAAADDKGDTKRQRKGASQPDSDAQPHKTAQQNRRDRSSRDSTDAQASDKAKRASAAAADDADASDRDHRPGPSAAAKSSDRGKGRQKGSKSNTAATETLARPEAKRRRTSGAVEAEGDGPKQKKSQGGVKHEEQPTGASGKAGSHLS